jgi:hypothetical protein
MRFLGGAGGSIISGAIPLVLMTSNRALAGANDIPTLVRTTMAWWQTA